VQKKKKKLTHTMRNTQRKESRQTTPTKETPGQTKPTVGRGSGSMLAVGLARPTPVVGLVPRRQWVWPNPTSNPPKSASKLDSNAPQIISNASKSVSNAQNSFLMPQNLFFKSNLKPKRKKLTLRDLIT
jgi:hypothetical protein